MKTTFLYIFATICAIYIIIKCFLMYMEVSKNGKVEEFQYKSHSYIYFYNKGVVHNPNCKTCQLIYE